MTNQADGHVCPKTGITGQKTQKVVMRPSKSKIDDTKRQFFVKDMKRMFNSESYCGP
jgi:hypothetical protein